MSDGVSAAAPRPGEQPLPKRQKARPGARRRRKSLSPLTVIGELLLVSGLAVLGYFGWQTYQTQFAVPAQQRELTANDSARWAEQAEAAADAEAEPWDGEVPYVPEGAPGEVFGVLYVPAFGAEYAYRIAETTDPETVLNLGEKGIGHYTNTQRPGEPGNFALAGHRSGVWTTPFREIMNLRVGDSMFVETAQGWYTYTFRSIEYVQPSGVEVLNPFPQLTGVPGDDQILTLTTCHPKELGTQERAISYAVFESYQPLSEGPPAELIELNPNVQKAA